MSDTAVGTPDPEKPSDRARRGPRMDVGEDGYPTDVNVIDFYHAILPKAKNGRLDGNSWGYDVPSRPDPTVTVRERRLWRERVRASIVRREEIVKSLPAMLRERARVAVYHHLFD